MVEKATPPKNPYNVSLPQAQKFLASLGVNIDRMLRLNRAELAVFKASINKVLRYAKYNADSIELKERGVDIKDMCPGSTLIVVYKKKVQPAVLIRSTKLKRVKIWVITGDVATVSLDKIIKHVKDEPLIPLSHTDYSPLPKAKEELKIRWVKLVNPDPPTPEPPSAT